MKPLPNATAARRVLATSIRVGAVLCLASCAALASPVRYTFTATTRASLDSPSHLETFDMIAPDLLPVVNGGPLVSFLSSDASLLECTPCQAPPVSALHFLRSGSGDLLQFVDQDGTNRAYSFAEGVFSSVGTWDTLPGINVNRGTLVVSATPEPSTIALALVGVALLAARHRRRRSIIESRLG